MGNAIRAARLSTNRYCEVCAAKLAPWLKTEGPHGPRAEPIFRKRDPTPDEATP